MEPRLPDARQRSTVAPQGVPMMTSFAWVECPRHPWYGGAGAIVVSGGQPWCPGDAAVSGHWVELERAA